MTLNLTLTYELQLDKNQEENHNYAKINRYGLTVT